MAVSSHIHTQREFNLPQRNGPDKPTFWIEVCLGPKTPLDVLAEKKVSQKN